MRNSGAERLLKALSNYFRCCEPVTYPCDSNFDMVSGLCVWDENYESLDPSNALSSAAYFLYVYLILSSHFNRFWAAKSSVPKTSPSIAQNPSLPLPYV